MSVLDKALLKQIKTMEPKEYLFTVTGGFDISPKLVEFEAWDGRVIGFTLPDGRIARLCVALEVEREETGEMEYITSSSEMADLGFKNLDYESLDFHGKI